jgi:DNA polymerase-3 subunit delta
MRLRPEQLAKNLQQQLQAVYVVSGDEELLVQEACDAIRAHAREQGCSEREVLRVEGKFDWNSLLGSAAEMSLFAERKLIELHIPSGKPGTDGSKALQAYLQNPGGDNILLIIAGKIDKQSTNSKWFKALDQAGVIIQVWPVDARQLPRWLQQRLQQAGLNIEADALQLLCERVEGNLLAAVQEVEKLRLLADSDTLTSADIQAAVTDNARYNLFDLVDHALDGDATGAFRMFYGLRSEGTESAVVLWALAREIRQLYQIRLSIDSGHSASQALQAARVWDKRQPLVSAGLQRHGRAAIEQLMQQAEAADRCIKGLHSGSPWDALSQLLLNLCTGSNASAARGQLA